MASFTSDNSALNNKVILGIDEVGRGPWAGPLVVGAVILKKPNFQPNDADLDTSPLLECANPTETDCANPKNSTFCQSSTAFIEPVFWQELTDSKKLTKNRREKLAPIILEQATATGLGWVTSKELDQYGLSASLKLATRRAVKEILKTKTFFSEIIIDGTVNFLKNTPLETKVTMLPKADLLIHEVSAASIIAKVARDNYMTNLATKYPNYAFDRHMGYGTTQHKNALEKFGLTPEHRKSFKPIQTIIERTKNSPSSQAASGDSHFISHNSLTAPKNTSQVGQTAEVATARHLEKLGHTIIIQNFKVKTAEIDLISIKNNTIFFTEVKYSKNLDQEGTPLVRIDAKKQQKMHQAAETFLKLKPTFQTFIPILAVAAVTGDDYSVEDWFTIVA